MPQSITIPAHHREFFHQVAQAAFVNPFSRERLELDHFLTQSPDAQKLARVEVLKRAIVDRIENLGSSHPLDFRRYAGDDREIMRFVFLFEGYHLFIEQMDAHISEQAKAGDAPRPAPFARDLLAHLQRRGFSPEPALRYLGIFYQLRRAFYFIVRGLIGNSPSMREFRRHLWNNVFTHDTRWYDRYLWNRLEDFSTLLLGETGTGKGAAARAIGQSGFIPFDERRGVFTESFMRSFISLNLSQYPEALIESELFGHRKGAFTGAVEEHEGIFARCSSHGAIFLDEIGDVSAPVQIKLLQVLQERTFSPVGSHERKRFKGRVIAATNQPLLALREKQLFRDDFFYRLCSDVLTVPPLRQRLQECPRELDLLVEHLVRRTTGDDAPELVAMILQVLHDGVGPHYAWPGNVRELEQAVRRILLTGRYQGDRPRAEGGLSAELACGIEAGRFQADELIAGYCRLLHQRLGTIEAVARRAGLDRRTVKRYLDLPAHPPSQSVIPQSSLPPDDSELPPV